jgi:hypothetical protein
MVIKWNSISFFLKAFLLAYISCTEGDSFDISEYAYIVCWLGLPLPPLSSWNSICNAMCMVHEISLKNWLIEHQSGTGRMT